MYTRGLESRQSTITHRDNSSESTPRDFRFGRNPYTNVKWITYPWKNFIVGRDVP